MKGGVKLAGKKFMQKTSWEKVSGEVERCGRTCIVNVLEMAGVQSASAPTAVFALDCTWRHVDCIAAKRTSLH